MISRPCSDDLKPLHVERVEKVRSFRVSRSFSNHWRPNPRRRRARADPASVARAKSRGGVGGSPRPASRGRVPCVRQAPQSVVRVPSGESTGSPARAQRAQISALRARKTTSERRWGFARESRIRSSALSATGHPPVGDLAGGALGRLCLGRVLGEPALELGGRKFGVAELGVQEHGYLSSKGRSDTRASSGQSPRISESVEDR